MFRGIVSTSNALKHSFVRRNISSVTIFGSGLMGSGIAAVSALAKYKVNVVDVNDSLLSKSQKSISGSIGRFAKKTTKDESEAKQLTETLMANVGFHTDMAAPVSESDLVIEAVSENIDLKNELFK